MPDVEDIYDWVAIVFCIVGFAAILTFMIVIFCIVTAKEIAECFPDKNLKRARDDAEKGVVGARNSSCKCRCSCQSQQSEMGEVRDV
ncbi:hypothetical protein WAI453_009584 [Rhynchosporium graminicola]